MHPIAFQLGPLVVTWYGILVVCGFMAGLWTASRRGRRDGLRAETILDMGPWLMVGTIVGARAWYCIAYWDNIIKDAADFHNSPAVEIFMVQHAGLVFYGGLIGASLACILYARKNKLPLWKISDALAPSIALGCVFGRWGCLMNGCCYGKHTTMPWGIRFPIWHESFPWVVHPVQIYDSLLNFALYLGLAWAYRRKKFDGQIFAIYLMCYAMTRSFVEIYRGDYTPEHLFHGLLTPAQLTGIIGLAIGGLLLWKLPRPGSDAGQPVTAGLQEKV
ncbi:MAG TPA: prolipoprotein diacylglyceryl transferase [Verrucomicrobiae bacterium]|nr:prolipoprotein diacylglyceryl transferase [Verrucomicrobiae bacterium]